MHEDARLRMRLSLILVVTFLRCPLLRTRLSNFKIRLLETEHFGSICLLLRRWSIFVAQRSIDSDPKQVERKHIAAFIEQHSRAFFQASRDEHRDEQGRKRGCYIRGEDIRVVQMRKAGFTIGPFHNSK